MTRSWLHTILYHFRISISVSIRIIFLHENVYGMQILDQKYINVRLQTADCWLHFCSMPEMGRIAAKVLNNGM